MEHNLEKLELNKILQILSSFCVTEQGKNFALELLPSNSKKLVTSLLAETKEAMSLIYRNSTPSFYEISSIEKELSALETGQTLSCSSLLKLAKVFDQASILKDYFQKDFLDNSDYPTLTNYFEELYTNKAITEQIFHSILDENTIDDSASSTLQSLRRKKRNLEQEIRNQLNAMIHSSSFSKYIQENIITIRNDRFVIPIKEEYRSFVKGLIHDISNAGSTVFIEPMAIFEKNNEIAKLTVEEDLEIEKILQKLSALFLPYLEEIKRDVTLITKLDFIFAKAKYAKEIKGIIPKINDQKELHLLQAKHPLLNPSLAVPISINLGKDFSTLLITGPNTGGKTVTLKTVGLLTLMACCGLAIPASESSSIYIFDQVFADIGDDQSISDSLSTFSSHILNIVSITKKASSDSLILLDELGSGTDPIEGANLAISILSYFKKMDALIIATTHYPELKQYALTTKGVENASVEFDVEHLRPTYKLLLGVPGKSNAFEISKNLGLSSEIITQAKSLMSNEQINMEELLKTIYDQKAKIEQEKEELENTLKKVSLLEETLEQEKQTIKQQKQDFTKKAKIEARNILLDAKEEANEIIKNMQNLSSSEAKLANQYRNQLNQKLKDLSIKDEIEAKSDKNTIDPKKLSLNSSVFVKSLNQIGTVISHPSKSNEVLVQIGSIKMNRPLSDLEINTQKTPVSKTTTSVSKFSKSQTISSEINVIGLNVEEANFVIDKFLDDASLAKLETIRIIHGKGTGKLKNGIHQFLKRHPQVKAYRMGTYGEGEMGVTVVTLK